MSSPSQHNFSTGSIGGHKFYFNQQGFTIVYADGSCINNGTGSPNAAGLGVWFYHGHYLNVSERLAGGEQTNHRAEIYAVIRAAEQAKRGGVQKLLIYTDSQNVVESFNQWIQEWKMNGWINIRGPTAGQPVKNRADLEKMDATLRSLFPNVRLEYVPGHSHIEGNLEADKLARAGASRNYY